LFPALVMQTRYHPPEVGWEIPSLAPNWLGPLRKSATIISEVRDDS
jgi:hypothetical protein